MDFFNARDDAFIGGIDGFAGVVLNQATGAANNGLSGPDTTPNVLTQSQVIDLMSGSVIASFPQVGGSDEVWYHFASKHYYLAARSNADKTGKIMLVMGMIDAGSNVFDGNVPTSTTAHSVAADRVLHHVFVPIGFPAADSFDPTNPVSGGDESCIAVYLPSSLDADDGGYASK